MGTPTLTVVIAHSGTEADASSSLAGHMYYVLTDANGNSVSYGFSPISEHSVSGAGQVSNTDLINYAPLTYNSTTTTITQAQFNALQAYGTPGSASYLQGFSNSPSNPNYNILDHSCVDFVWGALATIGIQDPSHVPGSELLPTWNVGEVQSALGAFQANQISNSLAPTIGFDANGNVVSITTYSTTGSVVSSTTYQYGTDGISVTATTTNASGSVTSTSSLSENPSTGATSVISNFDSNGANTGVVQISANTASVSSNITVSGQAAPVQINNATVTISSGATATVTGSNETVDIANGASATIVGQNDTVVFAGSGTASVSGAGDSVQLNSSDTLTLPGQATAGSPMPNEQVTVTGGGTGDTVNLGSGIEATLKISNATINSTLFGGIGDDVEIDGNSDHVNSNGASIIFNGQGDLTLPLRTASHNRRHYAARFSWAASQARSNCIGLT